MIGLFKKIAFIIVVILIVTFIIVNNHNAINLVFWPGKSFNTGLGIVLITSFVSGFIISAIIASYFSFKSYLKEKKLLKDKNKSQEICKKVNEARIYTCLKDLDKALKLWEELHRKDLSNIIPYIEIAKIFIEKENLNSALNILNEAKKHAENNEEVTFYLAKVHNLLKNGASSLDNYTKIYSTKPCAYIATLARDEAISIKQYDDALEYQKNIDTLSKGTTKNASKNEEPDDKKTDIEYLKILKETGENKELQIEKLEKLHKASPSHIKTGLTLSELLLNKGEIKPAMLVLTKLALNSKKAFVWRKIIKTWIEKEEPKKAISTINTALKETQGEELVKSYFIAVESFSNLAMQDDARAYFEMFEKFLKDNNITLNGNKKLLFDFLNAMLFNNKNISKLDLFSIIDNN